MDAMPQVPLAQQNLFKNPDRRCPVLLMLDTSGSMDGAKIDQLNRGFEQFKADVSRDLVALKRIEVAVVTFGPVRIAQHFVPVDQLSLPQFTAHGDTPMGQAVETGLKLLEDQKALYKQAGVPYFRPWAMLTSDGYPTDNISAACRAVRQAEASKGLTFWGVGVDPADMAELAKFSTRPPLLLSGLAFPQMFQWLSASVRSISRSVPGQQVPIANPTQGAGAWAVSA